MRQVRAFDLAENSGDGELWETTKAFSGCMMMSSMALQARSCTSMKDSPLGILIVAGSAIHLRRKSFSTAINSCMEKPSRSPESISIKAFLL